MTDGDPAGESGGDAPDAEADIGRRARRLAEGARHDGVTITGLLETVADGGHLYGDPPIEVLDPDEQPHFLFTNEVTGVSEGRRWGGTKPDPDGGTVLLVTDRRVLAVVGREDGDIEFSVPLADVETVEYATARTKGRLTVTTADTTYHCWVHRSVEESALAAAAAFVRAGGDLDAAGED
jgi:hypothetical protein